MIYQWGAQRRTVLLCLTLVAICVHQVAAKAVNGLSVAQMSAGEIEDTLHVSYSS